MAAVLSTRLCTPFPRFALVAAFKDSDKVPHQVKPGHTFKFSVQIWNENVMDVLIEGLYRSWFQHLDDSWGIQLDTIDYRLGDL